MQRFSRDSIQSHCDGSVWPQFLGRVKLGESFQIETLEVGPTGPIEIAGVEKGDTIAISIEKIDIEPPFKAPNGGPFYLGCGPLVELDYRDGYFYWPSRFKLKSRPSIGNVAILPEPTEEILELCKYSLFGRDALKPDPRGWRRVVRDTRDKHCHQDCSSLREGAKIYMKVNVDGAGLCVDDIHGSISEGELAFAAIETKGTVQLSVNQSEDWFVDWPLIETDEEIQVFCSYTATYSRRPQLKYVDLVREGYKAMRQVVAKKANCTVEEANTIVATACSIRNCVLYGLGEGYISPQQKNQPPYDIAIVACLLKEVFI